MSCSSQSERLSDRPSWRSAMTAIEIMNGRPESGGYKVDVSRGGHNGRVSSEWFSRPDDEKYLSLSDLYASVKGPVQLRRAIRPAGS